MRHSLFILLALFSFASQAYQVSSGKLEITTVPSRYIDSARKIFIWQPANTVIDEETKILFAHDGKMLFDAQQTWNKQEWGVDEAVAQLIAEQAIHNVVVVGIENAGAQRRAEYFPRQAWPYLVAPGKLSEHPHLWAMDSLFADDYLAFLINELKPFLQQRYGLNTRKANSFLLGSSMGGLISLYALAEYPSEFAGAAALSTHWPGSLPMQGTEQISDAILAYFTRQLPAAGGHKIYFDYGDATLDQYYPPLQAKMDKIMRHKGYTERNYRSDFYPDAEHSETAWQARLKVPLQFLLDTPKQAVKPTIYQVFTRLFGNTNTTNKPWGTMAENGVGKFADFTPLALQEIKNMGVSHIWYTGVPHHALVNDYQRFNIGNDDPEVIKGRAGSPYAVKDYYNVNPDLAVDPNNRLAEFEALIKRTHEAGLKVMIDIVPNHVARNYHSISLPAGAKNFGVHDDTSVTYQRDNNFYYNPNESFQLPKWRDGYQVLGGDDDVRIDGQFHEVPAKWTGNGSRASQPDQNDWYETVKINFGVRPDGHKDFAVLDDHFRTLSYAEHAAFWQNKRVPDSWVKFRDIAFYWLAKGVDGFRYDMAEMVPVEFWSYLNSAIKMRYPEATLLAEVYNPSRFRDYIQLGKMDYLYDKVDFYDSLKLVMQGKGKMSEIDKIQYQISDIRRHMLHFLENHDEQRIASPEFAGDMHMGRPAYAVSALISESPTMMYFGQEVGEDGSEAAGFGKPSRTSIFDYIGVPAHQRWMNEGQFDGGQLSQAERELREFYRHINLLATYHPSMQGKMISLHAQNLATANYSEQHYSFARLHAGNGLLVIANFSRTEALQTKLNISQLAQQITLRNVFNNVLTQIDNGQLPLDVAPMSVAIYTWHNAQ